MGIWSNISRVLLAILVFFSPGDQVQAWLFLKVEVALTNEMQKAALPLSCRSGDDILGMRHLEFRDSFGWTFNVDLFRTTKFWCYFYWHSSPGLFIDDTFDVFVASRDKGKGKGKGFYTWSITRDGSYLFDKSKDNGQRVRLNQWRPPKRLK